MKDIGIIDMTKLKRGDIIQIISRDQDTKKIHSLVGTFKKIWYPYKKVSINKQNEPHILIYNIESKRDISIPILTIEDIKKVNN